MHAPIRHGHLTWIILFALYRKTCPRRQSAGNEAQTIQPALDASELFSGVANSVAPPLASGVGNGHHAGHGVPITRLQPAKLEAALEAANKRVIAADKAVASATTEQDFDEATSQLDTAVRQFEKVASCAQRCAAVAQTLSGGWDINASPIVERESKRMRIDSGAAGSLTPTAIALNEATTGAAAEAVDASEVVAGEAKDEGLE